MLKFIKHHMETIGGVEVYPVISFIIFALFFTGLFVYVIRMDKKHIKEVTNIPLDSKETNHE